MKKLTVSIVGMLYYITPATLEDVIRECPLQVELRREPDNMHDENAIAVFCVEKPWKEMKFGHVIRAVASELAPRMDRGKLNLGECWLTEANERGQGELLLKPPTKEKSLS